MVLHSSMSMKLCLRYYYKCNLLFDIQTIKYIACYMKTTSVLNMYKKKIINKIYLDKNKIRNRGNHIQ